jgi:hypothetical protein
VLEGIKGKNGDIRKKEEMITNKGKCKVKWYNVYTRGEK